MEGGRKTQNNYREGGKGEGIEREKGRDRRKEGRRERHRDRQKDRDTTFVSKEAFLNISVPGHVI